MQACRCREASTHSLPVSRWKAVASGRPDNGCSTTVTSNSRPWSRFAVSTVTSAAPSPASAARTAAAWSRCAVPTAIRSAVSGTASSARSETDAPRRSSSRRTTSATARTASGSVRGVCRAGSSSRPQPDPAASSITRSGPEPSDGTPSASRRSPWPVPLRNGVYG